MNRACVFNLCYGVGLAFMSPAPAQDIWLNPLIGPTAGNWFQAPNWSSTVVPDSSTVAQINNGGEALASGATAPGTVVAKRIEVGKNGGTGTFTSSGVSIVLNRELDIGEVGGSFATGTSVVSSVGTVTIRDAALLQVGVIDGTGDIDVGQVGASDSAHANGMALITVERVDMVQVQDDIDVAQASATVSAVAQSSGTLVFHDVGTVSVGFDLDIAQVGGDGRTTAMGVATFTATPAITVGGNVDVGRTMGSVTAVNHGEGTLSISDSQVSVGFGNALVPGTLHIGDATTLNTQRAEAIGVVTLERVALNVANRIVVGRISGGGTNSLTSADGRLILIDSSVATSMLSVGVVLDGTAGSTSGTGHLDQSLLSVSDAMTLGVGSLLQIDVGGTTRADGMSGANRYGAIDTNVATLGGRLDLRLVDGFLPSVGDSFALVSATSLSGSFASVTLPQLQGLNWDLIISNSQVVASVVAAGLTGDYNGDGTVDAADYTEWRDTQGQSVAFGIGADGNADGVIDATDYNIWRSHFRTIAQLAGSTTATVSEPRSAWLLLPIASLLVGTKRRMQGPHTMRVPIRGALMRAPNSLPAGFTLVELLVVIAIIGVMVALLLPAVQSSREAARRTQCINQVKQLGLAFQNHHDTLRHFPSGGWEWNRPPTYIQGSPATGSEQQAGWGFQILPYIEQEVVWRSGAETAIGTPIATLFCPSRRGPQTVVLLDKYEPQVTGGMLTRALCDYAASNREQTGILRRYAPQRLSRVTDGTSHTLVLADKRLNIEQLGEPQDDDNEGYTVGWNEDTIRRTGRVPKPDHYGDDNGDGDGDKRFGSSHPNGISAAMADGSVRLVGFDVDKDVFRKLGAVSDGEVINDDEF